MNDFLGRLAARAQGEAAVVKPRVRSRFESAEAAPPPAAPEAWSEEVVEVTGQRKEETRDTRDDRDTRDGRDGRGREASPEPTVKAVEPREVRHPRRERAAERAVEAAPRPIPAPAPVEERPRPVPMPVKAARRAGGETGATLSPPPPEAPARPALPSDAPVAPAPRRSEPRIAPPLEPGPRRERRAEDLVESVEPAVPVPPETRPAARASRPAELRATAPLPSPLPTIGPRRRVPDPAPAVERAADTRTDTEEVVRVAIGRIDVHAGPPPPVQAPVPRRPAGPRLALADYLAGRNERRRR